MRCDMRVQYRNGFYAASALLAALWMLGLARLPREALARFLPPFLMANLFLNVFIFVSRQVMLEKAEGSLSMLDVSPLRPHEYLAAKVGSLTLLAALQSLAIALVAFGPGFRFPQFLAGIAAASALLTLAGFILVSSYDSIRAFLIPSALSALVLALPFLPYIGFAESGWLFLHPLQGPLSLLRAAFGKGAAWETAYGLVYPALWAAAALILCKRALARMRAASG
jgi:fluoroquinolone transport system permease protein